MVIFRKSLFTKFIIFMALFTGAMAKYVVYGYAETPVGDNKFIALNESATDKKPWFERFAPENLPTGITKFTDTLDGRGRYFEHQCEYVLRPQWKDTKDIQSAINQIQEMMSSIGASYADQYDIRDGYVGYTFKTNRP